MHSRTTMELFQYWNAVRGNRDLPRRDEIDPAHIRSLLPDLFILQRQASRDVRFRLAGTGVCALFGRELRDGQFGDLWLDSEADGTARIAEEVMTQMTPMLLYARGATGAGDELDVELLLAPLASSDGTNDRLLGALSPLARPVWLHMTPLTHLVSTGLSLPDASPNLPLDHAYRQPATTKSNVAGWIGRNNRKVSHLRILDGGRRD
ncbi:MULTISPECIES: PAS domain-containing protein [Sinorhizobium]|nr:MULTISPECIES: PAS domain-containing protein [Sinorhizobium]PDT39949.1 PAS domain-containing protein [Sinorhizobium sp. FG01]PDT55297.1 PAS domain-containing protein [Sinorhizobium sp. NG07B]